MFLFEDSIAIDIRSDALYGVLLGKSLSGYHLLDYMAENLPDETDPDRPKIMVQSLSRFAERNNLQGHEVLCSIPRKFSLIRFLTLPIVSREDVNKLVRFEAERHLPGRIDDYFFDAHVLDEKIGKGMQVLFVAVPRTIVLEYVHILGQASFVPSVIDISGFNALNTIFFQNVLNGDDKTTAFLQFGKNETELTLLRGKKLEFIRTLKLEYPKCLQDQSRSMAGTHTPVQTDYQAGEEAGPADSSPVTDRGPVTDISPVTEHPENTELLEKTDPFIILAPPVGSQTQENNYLETSSITAEQVGPDGAPFLSDADGSFLDKDAVRTAETLDSNGPVLDDYAPVAAVVDPIVADPDTAEGYAALTDPAAAFSSVEVPGQEMDCEAMIDTFVGQLTTDITDSFALSGLSAEGTENLDQVLLVKNSYVRNELLSKMMTRMRTFPLVISATERLRQKSDAPASDIDQDLSNAVGLALRNFREAAFKFNFLPQDLRQVRKRYGFWTSVVLGLLIVVSFFAWRGVAYYHDYKLVGLIQQKIEELQPELDQLNLLRDEMAASRELISSFSELEQKMSIELEILTDLTERIPDKYWLNYLLLDKNQLTLHGMGESPEMLVQNIDASPYLEAVKLERVVDDRFTIEAQIEEAKPDQKQNGDKDGSPEDGSKPPEAKGGPAAQPGNGSKPAPADGTATEAGPTDTSDSSPVNGQKTGPETPGTLLSEPKPVEGHETLSPDPELHGDVEHGTPTGPPATAPENRKDRRDRPAPAKANTKIDTNLTPKGAVDKQPANNQRRPAPATRGQAAEQLDLPTAFPDNPVETGPEFEGDDHSGETSE